MLVVGLGVGILMMAIPSVAGFFAGREIEAVFEEFDAMAQRASRLAAENREPYVILWEKGTIRLRPERIDPEEAPDESLPSVERTRKRDYRIAFPAALVAEPEPIWTFWPTGTCEPAVVEYEGPEGKWRARYDPLTARPTLEESSLK